MSTFARPIAALVLALSLAASAGAQELVPSPPLGSRVRLQLAVPPALLAELLSHGDPRYPGVPPRELSGTLTAQGPDAFDVRTTHGRDWSVPTSSIRRLEVSRGPRSRVRQALLYGLGGAALGVCLAAAQDVPRSIGGRGPYVDSPPRLLPFVASFGALGALAGAIHPGDRWETVYRRD